MTRRGPKSNTSIEQEGEDERKEEDNKSSSRNIVKQALDRVFTGVQNERTGKARRLSRRSKQITMHCNVHAFFEVVSSAQFRPLERELVGHLLRV